MQQQAEQNGGSNLGKLKGYANKVNNYGNKLSIVGDAIKDNINNEVAKKIGTSMSNIGGTMQNGANSVTNVLDKPANYFRGFAGNGLQNLGAKLGTQGGAIGTLGNGISSLGTTVAGGTGAGAATGAAAAGTAGTAAGTAGTVGGLTTAGSAGAGAAGGAAAGSGAAAGGAAAGGSAAGGAAAAGPIGALIALGIMAAQGTNRKRAKKSGEALLSSTNQMSEQGNEEADQRLALTQQNSEALQQQAQEALAKGIMTGGAAQIQDANGAVSDFPTTKEAFAKSLRDNGWDDLGINSALNGLNNGNKEMSDYINYYNTVAQDGQKIAIPQTEEEIANARALASGQNPQQTGNVQQTEQLKRGLLDKFISGIGDFSRGYEQNRNTAFAPTNLQEKTFTDANGQQIDKGGMARMGEAIGTIGRMVNKPAVQALVAGGLSTALTGNPLYGLGMASKYGGQRAMSNIYQDALAKQGIQADPGMFGAITSTDMNALMMPQYKEQANEILKARLDEQQRYHDLMMQYYQDKLKETHENNVRNQEIKDYKAKNGTKVTHISAGGSGKGGGKTTQPKPQDNKDWNADLAGFTQIMTDPRYVDKAGEAKARFIKKYGVDPMKYVKL